MSAAYIKTEWADNYGKTNSAKIDAWCSRKALVVKYSAEQYELRFSHFLEVHSYKESTSLLIHVCHLNLPRIDTWHSGSIRFFHFFLRQSVCFVWLAIFDFFPLGLVFCYLRAICYTWFYATARVCVWCVHCAMITSQFPPFVIRKSFPYRVHFSYFEWHILFSTF